MRYRVSFYTVALAMVALLVAFPAAGLGAGQGSTDTTDFAAEQGILEAYGELPLLFIENQGQLDEAVRFYVKASGQTLYLTGKGIVFDLVRSEKAEAAEMTERQAERLVYSLDFIGANSQPIIEGVDKQESLVSFFIGNDPERWRSGVPTYRELIYRDIYPDIDLRLYGSGGTLRYDFIVRPGAKPESIALAYDGIESLAIEDGELVVSTAFGEMVQSRPYIYQEIGGEVVEVDGGFRLGSDDRYGFHVGVYNTDCPLVIDPVLAYSTYLGGSGYDCGYGIAVDSAGCAYVTGGTYSTDFPTENPWQGTHGGGVDAFVAKLSADGTALLYSTYLGGSGYDFGRGIAVDSAGCAYVTGETRSTDFHTTPGALQCTYGGGLSDAFVAKLSVDGASLAYSTYLGGSEYDYGSGVAVDSEGCAYVTGSTSSTNFPTRNPYQPDNAGYTDAFVAKLSAAGDGLVYSTYLGGSSSDYGSGIAVDSEGCAYVTGSTSSTNFPTRNPYQRDNAGYADAFVAKLSAAGDSLVYSTYLGGSDYDLGEAIAVDSAGCAYVTGWTWSTDFPTENPYQGTKAGVIDAFVAKLSVDGSAVVYSTYLGGSSSDYGYGIAVDSVGCAYVTGETYSGDFPTENPYQGTNAGDSDAFVAKLSANGAALVYSTYLGGGSWDYALGMAVDSAGCAYVTGGTYSTDFPTENPWQGTNAGYSDAFVAKLCVGADGPPAPAAHRGGNVYPVWTVLLAGIVAGGLLMLRRRHRGQESA